MARRSRKTKTSVTVDLSNVGTPFKPDQTYDVEVVECTLEAGDAAPYFKLKFQGLDEEHEKSFLYHNATTSEKAAWRLRGMMDAMGMEIPDGPMELEPGDFLGKVVTVTTYLDRYEGGSNVKIEDFFEYEGDGKKSKSKSKKDEDDDKNEVDVDDLSDDQIKALGKSLELGTGSVKKLRAKLKKMDSDELSEAMEELDEDEDEDEDEGDGKKSKSKSKSKKKSLDEDSVKEMNEDQLEELIDEHDLDVDLDDFKTLRKKQGAVIDALEEAGLLDD